MRTLLLCAIALAAAPLLAAERTFDFGEYPLNQTPPGFTNTVAGEGKPGDWRIILDDVPSSMPSADPQKPLMTKSSVLAQVARDQTDEHFPMLIFENERYGDFTLTTRFKTVAGEKEQMAGIAFRVQDSNNFYVVRASSLGSTFRFYKVVNGERGPAIGPSDVSIPSGVWHELTVQCTGNQILCLLDGKGLIPPIGDSTFTSGKIAFWTKSDSVTYFVDTKITYTPQQILAQTLVDQIMEKYPRILGLKMYAVRPGKAQPVVVASKDKSDIGQTGSDTEQDVITNGKRYHGKDHGTVSVTLPLRDNNGDPVAAVRITLKSFLGETEKSALLRGQVIMKEMENQVPSLHDLLE